MIDYNVDFLIAAFIIVSLIIIHFMSHKRQDDMNSRIFLLFAILGLTDIVFELISTYYIATGYGGYGVGAEFSTTVFYIMQILLPFTLVCYTKSLRETKLLSFKRAMIMGLPTIAMLCVILTNPFTGNLFYFDPTDGYVRGPWYLLTYLFALVHMLIVIIIVIRGRKELGYRKTDVLREILILCTVGILVQLHNNTLLTTGFGVSLGIMALFFTINNPYANTDNLTGLYDKTYFIRQCKELLATNQSFHVIEIELYQLRHVNKVAGSRQGDYLLKNTSKSLNKICGKNVYHISGKRFVIIANTLREYEDYLDQLEVLFNTRQQVEDAFVEFPAILSGIINAEQLNSGEEALDYAEYLASLAPKSGMTELVQDDEQTMENFQYNKKVEKFLYEAVDKDLFEVYFQPIFALKEKKFMAIEALSRLYHPELGFIPPDMFIRQAEKNGLIIQISNLQLRRICEFLRDHRELMNHIRNVKINLSPMELLTPDSGKDKIRIIKSYGIPCEWFQVEITETVATKYRVGLMRSVETFKEAGMGLCLDDFGSGYANLNTVMQLPFNIIKLDRSLLFNIREDKKVSSFYQSIVVAFKNMGYHLVAEGVETKEELELLEKWGVDCIQGYYFSKPLPKEQLLEFIEKQ